MSRDRDARGPRNKPEERPWRERFNDGLRAGIPFGVVALVLSISFGVVARPVMGVAAPIVMSAVIFAGSSQYAAIAVLAAGGGPIPAILAGVLLSARYAPMGITLAPSLSGGMLKRAAVGQAIIDLSWVAASRRSVRPDPVFMIGATLPSYPLWVAGTAIGVLGGGLIGDPDRLGLDALIPAVFLALLFGGEVRPGRSLIAAALLGAAVALALLPAAPAGVPVIASCLGALVGLWGPAPDDIELNQPTQHRKPGQHGAGTPGGRAAGIER
jgi:4-azaleucine resistance transporter AzlC